MFLESSKEEDPLNGSQMGTIFNIQRYSIHDGPGIRSTVFLKGCPLRCKWCSNPESINPYPEIFLRVEKCDQCGKCLEVCTPQAITFFENSIRINRTKCDLCMKCENACSFGAINRIGYRITVNDVVTEVIRDELFYKNSEGGVTISGGEPLYQIEFTLSLLKEFKEKSIHTTIDTTGYARWEDLERILDYTDLILFDIKHLDNETHQKGTGVKNELILNNLEKILKKRLRVWIRVPVIPNFNDSNLYMTKLAEFLSEKPIEKVSLLKYHEWGRHKYKYLDRKYPLKDAFFLDDLQIQEFKSILESYNLNVTIDY